LKSESNEVVIREIHNEVITSFAARALAIRRVTTNKGGKTPGIDKIL
jgi:hypothetical protein